MTKTLPVLLHALLLLSAPILEATTDVTLVGNTLAITDVDGGNSTDQLDITFSGGTYTISDTGGLTLDASTVPGSTGSGTSTVTVPQGSIDTVTIHTLAGSDSIRVQQVPAGTTFNINGGDNTDTIDLGSAANSLGGLLGNINVSGDGHDAGSTSLNIRFATNTLDSGDILNINDQGDAGAFTYALGANTVSRTLTGTITYATIETLNLNASAGAADVNVTGTGDSINTNIVTQDAADDIDITTTGIDSNLTITTGAQNDDVNFATVGGDGGDSGFLSSFNRITTGAGNDTFTQQNAPQNAYFEANLEAGTDIANVQAASNAALTDIRAGDNTDTLNWGNASNTLDNYAGILIFDGGNHDAGSSSLTIKGETNTLDAGDIVNLFDQGDTSDLGYQFQAPNTLAREGAGALQHSNAETINVFTTSGVVNFIAFGSAPGINYNLQAQGSNDSFLFFNTFGVGADCNVVINGGGGADDFDVDETGGGDGGAGAVGFGAFILLNGEGGNDTFAVDDVHAEDRVELNGGAGDDTFNVTPGMGCISVIGGTATTSSPGDTLNFTQPSGQTSSLNNQMTDSGTYQTTGSFGDVVYDMIESGPPPFGDTEVTLIAGFLIITDINGGTSADDLTISYSPGVYTITDNGGLIITTAIAGSTGDGTSTVTIPDTGVDGINFNTLDGNDEVSITSVQPALAGDFLVQAGLGNDTVNIDANIETGVSDIVIFADLINLNGTADLGATSGGIFLTADLQIVMDPSSNIDVTSGDIILNANLAGTAAGNFCGLDLSGGSITTVDGAISLNGTGGDSGTGNHGVCLGAAQNLQATGTGTIMINGTSGSVGSGSYGVRVNGASTLSAANGNLTVTGTGNATNTASDIVGVLFEGSSTLDSTGTGNISLTGIGGTSAVNVDDNHGVILDDSVVITSSGSGDIVIDGTGNGTGALGVFTDTSTKIQATGTGNIDIDGVSGDSGTVSHGVALGFNTTVSTTSGTINIDGTSLADAIGNFGIQFAFATITSTSGSITLTGITATREDLRLVGGSVDSGSGDLTLNGDEMRLQTGITLAGSGDLLIQPRTLGTTIGLGGGAGTLNLDDAELGFLVDGFSSITIGDTAASTGTVDIDTVTFTDPVTIAGGVINDAAGTDIAAGTNPVTLDGNVAPGQSPGILNVTGNFAFAAGATLEAEITGTTPGTQHDQIAVTGTVNLNNANLAINDTGLMASVGQSIVLIDNDGADTITGTFLGFAEGASVTLGGLTSTISYLGGDGNDVTITVSIADLTSNQADADFDLFAATGAAPGSGSFSGTGVTGGTFSPMTGPGLYTITFTPNSGNASMFTIDVTPGVLRPDLLVGKSPGKLRGDNSYNVNPRFRQTSRRSLLPFAAAVENDGDVVDSIRTRLTGSARRKTRLKIRTGSGQNVTASIRGSGTVVGLNPGEREVYRIQVRNRNRNRKSRSIAALRCASEIDISVSDSARVKIQFEADNSGGSIKPTPGGFFRG